MKSLVTGGTELGESHIRELVWRWECIISPAGTFQNQCFQLKSVGDNGFIANTDVRYALFVSDVVVWRFCSCIDVKQDQSFAIKIFEFEVNIRNRVKPGLDIFADDLGVAFGIGKPDYPVIVADAEYQRPSIAVSECGNALEPALGFAGFELLFLVIGGRLSYKVFQFHILRYDLYSQR